MGQTFDLNLILIASCIEPRAIGCSVVDAHRGQHHVSAIRNTLPLRAALASLAKWCSQTREPWRSRHACNDLSRCHLQDEDVQMSSISASMPGHACMEICLGMVYLENRGSLSRRSGENLEGCDVNKRPASCLEHGLANEWAARVQALLTVLKQAKRSSNHMISSRSTRVWYR